MGRRILISVILVAGLSAVVSVVTWRVWAEHVPRGCSFATAKLGSCDEEEAGMTDALAQEEGCVSNLLAPGDWFFLGVQGAIAVRTIHSGLNELTFTSADGLSAGCVMTYNVMGAAFAFDIVGPCRVEEGTQTDFTLRFKGDREGSGVITNSGSVLKVRKKVSPAVADFQPVQFGYTIPGDQTMNIVDGQTTITNDGGIGVTFLTEGLYEMEVEWKLPAPPNGVGLQIVGSATKKVVAGGFATVAKSLKTTEDKLKAQVCGPPSPSDPPCEFSAPEFSTDEIFNQVPSPLGVTQCDGLGGFTYSLNAEAVKKQVKVFEPVGTAPETFALFVHYMTQCTIDHEQDHVNWLSNPANGSQEICKGCCCFIAPALPDPDCEKTERRARERELGCVRNRKNLVTDPVEILFLNKYRLGLEWFLSSGDLCKG